MMEAIAALTLSEVGTVVSIMSTVATLGSSVGASVATSQQAEAEAATQRFQAQQAELQGRQNALNYNRQAYDAFQRQLRVSATLRARAAAGGVDPFTGSALNVDQMNSLRASQELQVLSNNAKTALYGGLAQSQQLNEAASITESTGALSATGTLIGGVAKAAQIAVPSTPKTSAGSVGSPVVVQPYQA